MSGRKKGGAKKSKVRGLLRIFLIATKSVTFNIAFTWKKAQKATEQNYNSSKCEIKTERVGEKERNKRCMRERILLKIPGNLRLKLKDA